MWLTLQIALWGTGVAILLAIPLRRRLRATSRRLGAQPARLLMNVLRAVPDLVVGTVFIVAVGLGPFSGVMAIAVNTGGVLAKLFSEGAESIDPRPVEGIARRAAPRCTRSSGACCRRWRRCGPATPSTASNRTPAPPRCWG